MSTAAQRILVSGRVQGVGFRWSAQREAQRLGVAGWIRNLHDGRVEVLLEGGDDDPAVRAMLGWLERGPRWSHVEGCDVRPASTEGLDTFEVRPSVHG